MRKGIISKATYNLIWSCLHPDSRGSVTDEKLARAFREFEPLEKLVLSEKENPTRPSDLPKTAEEWLARKAKVQAERKAQRDAKAKAKREVAR